MTFLDFSPEVLVLEESDGFHCDMTPEESELARASIAFLGHRLLLTYRMKRSGAYRSNGGWVAMRHFQSEIDKEIAQALGIRGAERDRIAEVRRLYKVARKAVDEDETYRKRVYGIMEDFENDYDLDAGRLGIVFI